MKLSTSLVLIAAILAAPATAEEYTVKTCDELRALDDTMVTGLIIESDTFACDEYTRFVVRNNMILQAITDKVEFSNFSLKVTGGGELTVEPDVVFNGVVDQEKNGGVLRVNNKATAIFIGTAEFNDNSVSYKIDTESETGEFIYKKGGAVFNKGELTFEKDATFAGNQAQTDSGADDAVKGGAVANSASGSILFRGKLTMNDNVADGLEGLGSEAGGGAIYNFGNIVVEGESVFSGNRGADGGAIHQGGGAMITFERMVTFSDNFGIESTGGAISNFGGVVNINAGSTFEKNRTGSPNEGDRGGAVYNGDGGEITLKGSTTFRGNTATSGGAIYNEGNVTPPATITYPEDTVFEDNGGVNTYYCNDVHNGDDDDCPDM